MQSGEKHNLERSGWLRAAVLGANDGILSTASLIVGVAAAASSSSQIALSGIAGLVAGAMSMAAGEYVSVSSQADAEAAVIEQERLELEANPRAEMRELAGIYVKRGLDRPLAVQVAQQFHAKDALAAHARDELGITEISTARPVQAALASAASFAVGAAVPLATALLVPRAYVVSSVFGAVLLYLAALGAAGARLGSAPMARPVVRVMFWGALAMGVTAGIGRLVGTSVG